MVHERRELGAAATTVRRIPSEAVLAKLVLNQRRV
eukprot:CAMPEP_0197416066 /NCGR_PEP_ID=MMETSP1170-20131217/2450_1 /TAXON_ID=54406 /ORGANISM="Sarcinochrysis sp, Strain CCMP770" /LENGTH=34 /DNA_ID= /DNA_START= /DNA_END= /DNA_ORIENTATION=